MTDTNFNFRLSKELKEKIKTEADGSASAYVRSLIEDDVGSNETEQAQNERLDAIEQHLVENQQLLKSVQREIDPDLTDRELAVKYTDTEITEQLRVPQAGNAPEQLSEYTSVATQQIQSHGGKKYQESAIQALNRIIRVLDHKGVITYWEDIQPILSTGQSPLPFGEIVNHHIWPILLHLCLAGHINIRGHGSDIVIESKYHSSSA